MLVMAKKNGVYINTGIHNGWVWSGGVEAYLYVSRPETKATLNYRKLDRESLRVLIGIGKNSLYLYRTMFTCAVDREMLVLI